jgi:hypothetical protein
MAAQNNAPTPGKRVSLPLPQPPLQLEPQKEQNKFILPKKCQTPAAAALAYGGRGAV